MYFCHFEKLKTLGAEVADTTKIELVVQALWERVAAGFQKGVREIFPKYLNFNAYGKPWVQTSELFKPNSPNSEKAQKHVRETLIPYLET